MNPRLRVAFTFFIFSLIALFAGLWEPVLSWSVEQSALKDLKNAYRQKWLIVSQQQAESQKKRALQALKSTLTQENFLGSSHNETKIVLSRLSKKHHVVVKNSRFSDPFLEQTEPSKNSVICVFTPFSLSLKASSEKKIHSFFKAFTNQAKGVVISKKLTLSHTHKNEFEMQYEGWIAQGRVL